MAQAVIDQVRIWDAPHRASRDINPFRSHELRHLIGTGDDTKTKVIEAGAQLNSGRPISIDEAMGRKPCRKMTLSSNASSDKQTLINALDDLLDDVQARKDPRNALALALDEMFTNAIYNAPTSEDGLHPSESQCRRQAVLSPKPVLITLAAGEERAAVCVRDHYGSLRPEKVLRSLDRCYVEARPEEKEGGAGLGFFMLMQSASRLIVNVSPGEYTEIIFVRDIRGSRRHFMRLLPTLNLCQVRPTRSQPRFQIEGPAVICRRNAHAFPGTIRDVSPKGCFVEVPTGAASLQAGDVIDVYLSAETSAKPSQVHSVVVRWVGQSSSNEVWGFGAEFSVQSEETDELVRLLLENNF